MTTRRQFLTQSALATLGVTSGALGFPALVDGPREETLPDGSASRGMINPRAEKAIATGLSYLVSNKKNGSFGTSFYDGNTAVTSLVGLAFLASGAMPNRGPHGRLLTEALRFILSMDRDRQFPGYLHNSQATPHGPMYGHGFATLFLAEMIGQIHDRQLREQVNSTLHKAVALILNGQNVEGGWRYTPNSREADLSVTVCQIMALRAARNAGINVPRAKVDKCIDYVKNCQNLRDGSFKYMLQGGGGGGGGFARTAAGVAALNSAGIYRGPVVESGIKFLRTQRPNGNVGRSDFLNRPDMHYFYGHYYAAQAMWTAGGEDWNDWYPAIRDELLASQRPDGHWQDQICSHYATAMALLVLQVPNNYLTIFQK